MTTIGQVQMLQSPSRTMLRLSRTSIWNLQSSQTSQSRYRQPPQSWGTRFKPLSALHLRLFTGWRPQRVSWPPLVQQIATLTPRSSWVPGPPPAWKKLQPRLPTPLSFSRSISPKSPRSTRICGQESRTRGTRPYISLLTRRYLVSERMMSGTGSSSRKGSGWLTMTSTRLRMESRRTLSPREKILDLLSMSRIIKIWTLAGKLLQIYKRSVDYQLLPRG